MSLVSDPVIQVSCIIGFSQICGLRYRTVLSCTFSIIMLNVRALLLLLSYLYLVPTVSAKLGEIKCYNEGPHLYSPAEKAKANFACVSAINRMLPGSGYHPLSGHDPFNRDFSTDDCAIHVEGLMRWG